MNKTLKITLITLASLLTVIIITVIVACWLILTPARLTTIVRNQAPNFISCDFNIEKVDLTLFKSFPNIGLKIDDLVLVNPMDNNPSDTLAYLNECVVSVNIKKFLNDNEIIINECRLNGGYINIFTDTHGNSNMNIFPPSEPDTIEESSEFNYGIDLALLKLNEVSVNYTDLSSNMLANVDDLSLLAKGSMNSNSIIGDVDLELKELIYSQSSDSLSTEIIVNDFKIDGNAEIINNNIKTNLTTSSSDLLYNSGNQLATLTNLDLSYIGDINNFETLNGNAGASINNLTFSMGNENLIDNVDLRLILPLNANISTMDFELGKSQIALNNIIIDLIGSLAMPDNNDINLNLNINTNTLIVEEVIDLIPESMRKELLDGIDVKGELQLIADVNGTYNSSSMPIINAEIAYDKGYVAMPELLPYPISDIKTSLKLDLDLNNKSDIYVNLLKANMSNSSLNMTGTIKDVMNKMICNINMKATADIDELYSYIPEDIKANGIVNLDVQAAFNNEQITNMDLMKTKIKGEVQWDDMHITYYDTITADADKLNISINIPNSASQELSNSLAAINIKGNNLNANVSDMIATALKDYNIHAQISNLLNENSPMSICADFGISRVDFKMDDIDVSANNPSGTLAMLGSNNSDNTSYIIAYNGDSLSFNMGEEMDFVTETLNFNLSANHNSSQQDLLLQWNPHAGIKLTNAIFSMKDLTKPVYIPSIDFNYDTTGIVINKSSILFGNSDFSLQGAFTNVDEFIRKEELLVGNLDFTSRYTDINELMTIFSGMGDTTIVANENEAITDTIQKEDDPFIVPLGVDITLNTMIENAVASDMKLSNIGGGLRVKDGILVLQEMGFTSDAATMMVTAMYKSPRKNHLYLGLDLHLLEIDIAEMINLIPELDTIVPMLKSFAGKAEFHFAAETYMKSNYDLKISTLRGAAAIRGKDLVVLDNETFRRIAKLLNFKDKNHNKIDNLSVEMTAFKNEIDVYPTLITLDKYQAVVQGRHNLNMTFDYRLGLANPWTVRILGIELIGGIDDMKIKLRLKKNLNIEDPNGNEKENRIIEETIRLKSLIYNSLNDNIKR